MAASLWIENSGAEITRTNFWETEAARAGKFYLSINAGAFRLLVPQAHMGAVRDMRAAHIVVVSQGPMTLEGRAFSDAIELLFDDSTEEPWSLYLTLQAVDRMPLNSDSTQEWTCTVWTPLVGERCSQVLARRAYYRRVRRLPDL